MQTRRFVLAEKELMISLDLLNEALAKERGNVYVESLAQLIGILDNLYRLQNKKEEKQEFILLLTEGFQDDEKHNEYYLNLMKTILS